MQIKVLKGTNQIGGAYTEVSTKITKILLDFGLDLDDVVRLPNIEGLTCGEPQYDAIFISHRASETTTVALMKHYQKFQYICQIYQEKLLNVYSVSLKQKANSQEIQ